MAFRNQILRIPCATQISSERSTSERPVASVQKLLDSSSSDTLQDHYDLKPSTTKNTESAGHLKGMLKETSARLKNFQNQNFLKSQPQSVSELSSEISRLKHTVRILELEKKELELENARLQCGKKGSSGTDGDPRNSVIRYGKFFVAKVKKDIEWNKLFKDIFGSEEEFVGKINAESSSALGLGLLQFVLEVAERPFVTKERETVGAGIRENRNRGMGFGASKESISKMFKESVNITEKLGLQKSKLEKAYENVKETVAASRRASGTPGLSRPSSNAKEPEKCLSSKNVLDKAFMMQEFLKDIE